jgi:hypothetical protein
VVRSSVRNRERSERIHKGIDRHLTTQTQIAALDVEQEFVNHLADKDSLEYILREGVSGELIIAPLHKSIYQFVQHHWTQTGKLPTLKVLAVEFPNYTFETPESTIQWTVDKLRERYQYGQVYELTLELGKLVKDAPKAMDFLRDKVFEIERNSLSSAHVWKPGDHKLFLRDLQKRVLEGHFTGVSTGFDDIDKFTGGIKKGNSVYFLARPKRQKTFFVCNAFIRQAMLDQEPYLFTLENTEEEIMLRVSCMLSGYPWDKAQKGEFGPGDYKLLEKAWDRFAEHKFWIEMPAVEERTIPALLAKIDKAQPGSVIISQFKYIQGLKDFYPNEHSMHAEIAVDLKRAATRPGKELPFLIEAQFNRGGDSMEELADFDASKVGLTDMIPQSADTLYGLFQNKDMRTQNTTEFGILEARNHDKAAWYVESEFKARTEIRLVPASQH